MLLFIISFLLNYAQCESPKYDFNNVHYIKNYDGDTITVNIPDIHPLLGSEISVRVYGIDTPELKTDDKCEKEIALKAQAFVETMIKNAKKIHLKLFLI